jgi:hypothetical protein
VGLFHGQSPSELKGRRRATGRERGKAHRGCSSTPPCNSITFPRCPVKAI